MKSPLSPLVTASLLLVHLHCSASPTDAPAPEASSGLHAATTLITQRGVCVTAHPLATVACQSMLNRGGSAADGAMAAAWMLGLVEPQSSGLGGGGYLVYFDGKKTYALDGRETAPKTAQAGRFLDAQGAPLPFARAVISGLSVGTPGMVRLMEQTSRRFGKLPWQTTLQPAIASATEGFIITPRLHQLLAVDPILAQLSAGKAFYPDGQPLAVGTRYTNLAYAQTLSALKAHGADYFYHGEIKDAILRAATAQGSDLASSDFNDYKVVTGNALCGAINPSYQVCGVPPSSSGGVAVLQILTMLKGQQPTDPVLSATQLTNASRLAFADRDEYLADPAFEHVPTQALLAPDYLAKRGVLALGARLDQVSAGLDSHQPSLEGVDAPNTSHISVVDRQGRAASMTLSIESAFGSHIWVQEGGFFLNNELTDFAFAPTNKGVPVANRVQGGKRPRSSMSPTLLLNAKATQVFGVFGSPGGSQIIGYVAQAMLDLLNGKTVQQTLDTPHILRRGDSTELESGRFDDAFKQSLIKAGHTLKEGEMTSGLAIIWRTKSGWVAGADPRREGVALGQK
jgi:gamma-glutamyltranspeptidase/glutathione hydrolase